MNQPIPIPFATFLDYFPETELPITLTDETAFIFSRENKPFSADILQQYLLPLEQEEVDEFTEFAPCFKLPNTFDFHALVYWKAGLLNHQFIMVTINKKAEIMDKQVIAGTFSDQDQLIQSVATIDSDFEILIVSGQQPAQAPHHFDASKSTTQKLELLPEGKIIFID